VVGQLGDPRDGDVEPQGGEPVADAVAEALVPSVSFAGRPVTRMSAGNRGVIANRLSVALG